MRKVTDLAGKRFSGWTVLSQAESKTRRIYWNCLCDCGSRRTVLGDNLKMGYSKSCGCLQRRSKHGNAKRGNRSKEYHAWENMRDRCFNPNYRQYHNYGGRGITVCDRWKNSFENFLADMGTAPSPEYTIDRKDNDGNYEPGNVRWADQKTQKRNKRTNRWITLGGRKLILTDWALELGINRDTLRYKLKTYTIKEIARDLGYG